MKYFAKKNKDGVFEVELAKLFSETERVRSDMHDYQNFALEFLVNNPFSALFIDMGLGKTCISLTLIMELLKQDLSFGPVLIVAPLRVANETWPTEIKTWTHLVGLSFKHIREDEIVERINEAGRSAKKEFVNNLRLNGQVSGLTPKQIDEEWKDEIKSLVSAARRRVARKWLLSDLVERPAAVHIINREQVEFLVNALGKMWPWKTVIIDESSSLKDHKTLRFKALCKVRSLISRMHQLTATPATETYLHLFAQIYLLDQGQRFGKSYTKFADKYFTFNKYSHTHKIREGSEDEIIRKISDICLVLKAEDYLELKEPIFVIRKVKLSEKAREIYDNMERHSIVELENGAEVEAETAAALSQKLLQLASGVLYETKLVEKDDDSGDLVRKRVVHHIHDEKIEELREVIEELAGNPVMVVYHFESSLARLTKAFPKAVVMDKAGKCVKKWNQRKIQTLLVHPQSAGHGLNLQKGGHQIVFFDIPWSLELYLQVIGRLARQGQQYAVVVHHLVAAGTVDEAVVEALRNKQDMQDFLFKLLKKLQKRLHAQRTKQKALCDEL